MSARWSPPQDLFRRVPAVVTHADIEGPPLTDAMVDAAEAILHVKLPASYLALMRICNGGYLAADVGHPTTEPTSWAPDHVGVSDLNGIPVVRDHDPADPLWDGGGILSSPYMIREWDLPEGLVLLTGDGHTWIALDHREGLLEPPVVWLDAESGQELLLAPDFPSFVDGLRPFDD